MVEALYNAGLKIYEVLIRIAATKNFKAKLWIEGRKNIFSALEKTFLTNSAPVAWFHCASLGEFEQARPVIESFNLAFPDFKILLTFFSPSGFEIRKNYPHADFIFYLPLDTKSNVVRFLAITRPKIVFFVKYEFWYNYLNELKKLGIKCILFSSIFRPNQLFFKSYGKFYKKILLTFTKIFVQDSNSLKLLEAHQIKSASISGDTRFDRVNQIATQNVKNQIVAAFKNGQPLLVVGSSWAADIDIILPALFKIPSLKVVIAPHEINENNLLHIEHLTDKKSIRYSQTSLEKHGTEKYLILDNIGMLSSIYQYADFAFIGGGYGKGIHNTLEAVAFGLPVFFGPNHHKFKEATELMQEGCAFEINSSQELTDHLEKLMTDKLYLATLQQKCFNYIKKNTGASEAVISYCKKILNK